MEISNLSVNHTLKCWWGFPLSSHCLWNKPIWIFITNIHKSKKFLHATPTHFCLFIVTCTKCVPSFAFAVLLSHVTTTPLQIDHKARCMWFYFCVWEIFCGCPLFMCVCVFVHMCDAVRALGLCALSISPFPSLILFSAAHLQPELWTSCSPGNTTFSPEVWIGVCVCHWVWVCVCMHVHVSVCLCVCACVHSVCACLSVCVLTQAHNVSCIITHPTSFSYSMAHDEEWQLRLVAFEQVDTQQCTICCNGSMAH